MYSSLSNGNFIDAFASFDVKELTLMLFNVGSFGKMTTFFPPFAVWAEKFKLEFAFMEAATSRAVAAVATLKSSLLN